MVARAVATLFYFLDIPVNAFMSSDLVSWRTHIVFRTIIRFCAKQSKLTS